MEGEKKRGEKEQVCLCRDSSLCELKRGSPVYFQPLALTPSPPFSPPSLPPGQQGKKPCSLCVLQRWRTVEPLRVIAEEANGAYLCGREGGEGGVGGEKVRERL